MPDDAPDSTPSGSEPSGSDPRDDRPRRTPAYTAVQALRAMLGPPPDPSDEEPGDNQPGEDQPGEDQPGEDPNPQP